MMTDSSLEQFECADVHPSDDHRRCGTTPREVEVIRLGVWTPSETEFQCPASETRWQAWAGHGIERNRRMHALLVQATHSPQEAAGFLIEGRQCCSTRT